MSTDTKHGSTDSKKSELLAEFRSVRAKYHELVKKRRDVPALSAAVCHMSAIAITDLQRQLQQLATKLSESSTNSLCAKIIDQRYYALRRLDPAQIALDYRSLSLSAADALAKYSAIAKSCDELDQLDDAFEALL